MSNDFSIDCETLGHHFDAPILSVGVRAFDKTTGKKYGKLYLEIALNSLLNPWQRNFRPTPETLAWWMKQSEGARKLLTTPDTEKKSLATALLELNHFMLKESRSGEMKVWANDPQQDITWLEHAYVAGSHGLSVPWGYNKPRSLRTITDLAEELFGWQWSSVKDVGTSHHAMDDADYQANVVISAYKAMAARRVDQDEEL